MRDLVIALTLAPGEAPFWGESWWAYAAAGWRAHNSGLTVLPPGYSACRTHSPVAKRLSIIFSCGLLVAAYGSSGKQASSENTDYSQALAFAKCMRSHGTSDFTDPGASGGISIAQGSGISSAAPAFHAAQRSCRHLLPGGGSLSGPPEPSGEGTGAQDV